MTIGTNVSYEALIGCSYLLRVLIIYLFMKMAHLNDWPAMSLATNIILALACLLFFFLMNSERVIKENNYSVKPNPARRPMALMGFVSVLMFSIWMYDVKNEQLSNIFVYSLLLVGVMCVVWLYYDAERLAGFQKR